MNDKKCCGDIKVSGFESFENLCQDCKDSAEETLNNKENNLYKNNYIVVEGGELDELCNKVDELVQKGYEPQGGIVCTESKKYYSSKIYYQAMFKNRVKDHHESINNYFKTRIEMANAGLRRV